MKLQRCLQSVGMKIFVEYYYAFKNEMISNQEMVEQLPHEYTIKSRRSRTSHARWIFQNGLNIDALNKVESSDRVASNVLEGARLILRSEQAS